MTNQPEPRAPGEAAPRDERLLSELFPDNLPLVDQVEILEKVILNHYPGYPKTSAGAIETAIQIMRDLAEQLAAAEGRAYKVDQYVKEWRLRFAEECAQLDTSQSYDSDFVLNLMVATAEIAKEPDHAD
jgi:hypothetical protein